MAAFRGREAEAVALIQTTLEQAAAGGQGIAMTWAHWTAATLYNGLGRYSDALMPAREASEQVPLYLSMRALPELVEAAARTDNATVADDALSRLEAWTQAGGTDWGLGTEARCRALLSEGAVADEHYREALERLGRTRMRPEVARAHLVYGEWLRRRQRHRDARDQLSAAVEMFDDIGMGGPRRPSPA